MIGTRAWQTAAAGGKGIAMKTENSPVTTEKQNSNLEEYLPR